ILRPQKNPPMKSNIVRFILLAICLLAGATRASAQSLTPAAARLIEQAGNTEDERERQTALEQLAALPGDPVLGAEAKALATFVDRWSNDPRLSFYGKGLQPRADGLREYDFKLRADSPLKPIAELYRGRM